MIKFECDCETVCDDEAYMTVDRFSNKETFIEIHSNKAGTQSIFLSKESALRLIKELEDIINEI